MHNRVCVSHYSAWRVSWLWVIIAATPIDIWRWFNPLSPCQAQIYFLIFCLAQVSKVCFLLALPWYHTHTKKSVLTAGKMAFAVSTRDQMNLEEFVATDSLANSCVVIGSSSPLTRCHGCFLKIQNRLKPFLSQWSRLFSFHLSERRRNQAGLKLLPRSRGAREWQKDRLWLQVSLAAVAS